MKLQLAEISRRGVIQALAGYAVAAWVVIEMTSVLAPAFLLPSWTVAAVTTIVVLGAFPVLLVSWRYDITREGIVRDKRKVSDEIDVFARRISVVIVFVLVSVTSALWINYYLALKDGALDSMYEAQVGAPEIGEDGLIRSIAVLPFADFSPGDKRQLLADGIPEAILHELAQHRELLVTARTSSFYFRDKDVTAAEIGRILGVEALLEGSVQVVNNRLRVTSQLVRTADQGHIWSNVYEAKLIDVFEIQDMIANTVRDLILAKSGNSVQLSAQQDPPSLEAYELVIEARNLLDENTLDAADRAISLLRLATEIAPDYADAHTWLSLAIEEKIFVLIEQRGESWWAISDLTEESSVAVERALELNPNDPVAILQNGFHNQGEDYYIALNKVLELAPNDPTALAHVAVLRFQSLEFAEGREHLARARRVDPSNYEALETYLQHFCGREELTTLVETQLQNYSASTSLALRIRELANQCDGRHVDAMTAQSRLSRIDTEPKSSVAMLLDLAAYGHEGALESIDDVHRLIPGLFSAVSISLAGYDSSIYYPDIAPGRSDTFRWFSESSANNWFFFIPYAALHIELGNLETALAILQRSQAMWERFYDYYEDQHFSTETTRIYALQAWILGQLGEDAASAELSRSLLAALEQRNLDKWAEVRNNLADIPLLVLLLNERYDEALEWLRGAEQSGWTGFQPLVSSPIYAELRAMPEAASILESMESSRSARLAEVLAAGIPEVDSPRLLVDRVRKLVPPSNQQMAEIAMKADRDMAAAARYYEAALSFEDVDPQLVQSATGFAQFIGEHEDALTLARYRLQLQPDDFGAQFNLAFAHFWSGDWDGAIEQFEKALEINSEGVFIHRWIGTAMLLKGDHQRALDEMEKVPDGVNRLLGLVMGQHAVGNRQESDLALQTLIDEHSNTFAYNIAYVLAFRGEVDRAYEWLAKAIVGANSNVYAIPYNPLLRNLHSDPRWPEMLRNLGVAPDQVADVEFTIPPLPKL